MPAADEDLPATFAQHAADILGDTTAGLSDAQIVLFKPQGVPPVSTSLEALVARQDVEDVIVKMFVATDERDWPTLQSCFTDPFVLDMTSMVGGTPCDHDARTSGCSVG